MNPRLGIAFFGFWLPAIAWTCTDLQFESLPRAVVLGADAQTLSWTVRANTTAGGCDFVVMAGNGGVTSSSNRHLNHGDSKWSFNLYKDVSRSRILKDAGEAVGADDVITGSFKTANGISRMTVAMRIAKDPFSEARAPGEYAEDIVLSLYDGDLRSKTLSTTALVRFSAILDAQVSASLKKRVKGSEVDLRTNGDVSVQVSGSGPERNFPAGRWMIPIETEQPVTIKIQSRE